MAGNQLPHDFESTQDAQNDSSNCDNIILLYMYEWCIINYSLTKYFPNIVKSPKFIVGQNNQHNIQLHVLRKPGESIQIKIVLETNVNSSARKMRRFIKYTKAQFNLELMDCEGKFVTYEKGSPFLVVDVNDSEVRQIMYVIEGVSKFIKNDMLTIRAKLSLKYPIITDGRSNGMNQLCNDMMKLFRDGTHSDITIIVDEQRFMAHNCILQTQLPCIEFIRSELTNEIQMMSKKEFSCNNVGSLKKVFETVSKHNENADLFLSILNYLYCGKIRTSDTMKDFNLYIFAQKYQLYELCKHLKPVEIYSRSRAKPTKVGFYWHIKDYSIHSSTKCKSLQSPIYKTLIGNGDIAWIVSLYFFRPEEISFSLKRMDSVDKDVQTIFKLTVCKPDLTFHEDHEFKCLFLSPRKSSNMEILYVESKFVVSPNLLYDDTLSLRCEITVSDGELTSECNVIHPENYSKSDLKYWLRNLINILETGSFSDMTLEVRGEEFKVHKAILSARSPVFEREMVGNLSGIVVIDDISGVAMKCALTYIYTGILNVSSVNNAIELYTTAQKYEIAYLKERCRKYIMDNISPANAVNVLTLSQMCNEEEMGQLSLSIVFSNSSNV